MADVTDSVTLEFNDISLVSERKPFPIIYVSHDAADLSVWFKTFIPDELAKTQTLEQIKWFITRVVDIDEWEAVREASLRATELYGVKNLSQIKFRDYPIHIRINKDYLIK